MDRVEFSKLSILGDKKRKLAAKVLPAIALLSVIGLAPNVYGQANFLDIRSDRLMQSLVKLKASGLTSEVKVDRLITGSVRPLRPRNRIFSQLPILGKKARLNGEYDKLEWPIYVTRADIAKGVVLHLGYKNAVSIMPEVSNLNVTINGNNVASVPLRSSNRESVLKLPVPPYMLKVGYNALKIEVNQRHRVDCTIDATYELWTEIVAAKSGLEYEAQPGRIQSMADLAAIPLNSRHKTDLRLLMGNNPGSDRISQYARLVQFISLNANLNSPVITTAPQNRQFVPADNAIDVFVGTQQELFNMYPQYQEAALNVGKLNILPSSNGRGALVAALVNSSNILARLTQLPENFSTRNGDVKNDPALRLATKYAAYQSIEKKTLTLKQLGYSETEFSGRRFTQSFDLNMPADFYAADYDGVELHLFGGYAPGLHRDSKIYIRVNGITKVSMSIGNPNGDLFEDKKLKLPLSAFSPGRNIIEFEAKLINDEDAQCNHGASVNPASRFLLSDQSFITVPQVAHYGQLPNMANTLMTGYPYVNQQDGKATSIYMSDGSFSTISAAISMANHLTLKAGKYLKLRFVTGAPATGGNEDAIVVGQFRALPQVVVNKIPGIRPQEYARAWASPQNQNATQVANQQVFPGLDRSTTAIINNGNSLAQSPDYSLPQGVAINPTRKRGGSLLDKWKTETAEKSSESGTAGLVASIGKLIDPLTTQAKYTERKGAKLDTSATLLASQYVDDGRIMTVITAPSELSMDQGVGGLLQPANYSGSQTVTFGYYANRDEVARSGIDAESIGRFDRLGFANARLLMAGWLSNHPTAYALLTMVLTFIIGVIASGFLARAGRPYDGGLHNDTDPS